MSQAELQALLNILRKSLEQIFGEQFVRMVLFGSRARGDARADSDVDVLIVLREDFNYGDVFRRTSELVSTLSLENDIVISTAFVSQERYTSGGSPFLHNVRREGIPV